MARTRISTTVDEDRLAAARARFDGPDSALMDRALEVFLRQFDAERERAALDAAPYDDDADLSWSAPDGPPLPYDGDVPEDVLRLAAERRGTYGR